MDKDGGQILFDSSGNSAYAASLIDKSSCGHESEHFRVLSK